MKNLVKIASASALGELLPAIFAIASSAPSKLNPEMVAGILAKSHTRVNRKELAAEYGISRTTLYEILKVTASNKAKVGQFES